MQEHAFGARAYAALIDMRQRTSALLADDMATPARRRPLWRRGAEAAAAALRLGLRWRAARSKPMFRRRADWIVLYSGRTPKMSGETDLAFIKRIARSNRGRPLPDFLGIAHGHQIVALEVRAGLNTDGNDASVLDYVLASLSIADLLKILARAARRPRHAMSAAQGACIDLLSKQLAETQTGVVMLTSNSLLAEIVRLAACGAGTRHVEVLHGIASVGMEAYYDFLEASSTPPPIFVNLIAGLRHFPSIERNLLRDEGTEVAVNTHMWARLGPDGTLKVPRAIAEAQPLVLVGGTSAALDYYRSSFFAAEALLLQMARNEAPDLSIVYCPHPANRPSQDLVDTLTRYGVAIASMPTFAMLFCAGSAVGTYSTSLFEAVLLGKRVFLLPFDHAMLMPELLEGLEFARSREGLHADFARFLESLPGSLDPAATERSRQFAQEALGVKLEYEPS